MTAEHIIFIAFPHEGIWKLYRDGELVCIFRTHNEAEIAARRFVASIHQHGKHAAFFLAETLDEAVIQGVQVD